MRCPTYMATDTEFTVMSTEFIREHPRLWQALNDWCRFHDIDPERVPLLSTLRRNVAERRVEYVETLDDEQIDREDLVPDVDWSWVPESNRWLRPAYSQGEGPPLPFPTAETPVLAVPS